MVKYVTNCLGTVAPYYNLIFVAIVILLFLYFFKLKSNKIFIKPWKFLFFGVLVFVLEELLTVFEVADLISVPKEIFPILEMIIIISFIYMLLIQKEFLNKNNKKKISKKKK